MARSGRQSDDGDAGDGPDGAGTPPRLERYRRKRDPARTNEPFEPDAAAPGETRRGVFVVHQHAATRMHWDLRIEAAGALESFAVPRGPSLSPAEKRLAMHTEPHPIDYLDFEAVIPAGNYGAGAMIVWDRGVVEYREAPVERGLAAGKIDLWLFGAKLRGRFALVRTARRGEDAAGGPGEPWLLLKKRDAFADEDGDVTHDAPWSLLSGLRVEELPEAAAIGDAVVAEAARLGALVGDVDGARLVPMKASLGDVALASPDRVYELKLDGVRLVADRRGDRVRLGYRSGRDATHAFPEIARAVRALPCDRLVLDGELVSFDEAGRPRFQRLATRLHATRGRERRIARERVPLRYVVFDVLQVGDRRLVPLPLRDRRRILERLLRGKGLVQALDAFPGHGEALLAFAEANRLEGLVAKRLDGPYRPGPRPNADWVKVKCTRDEDFVVLGFTRGAGARDALGALVVGSRLDDGTGPARWVERGRVGSGFDRPTLALLEARLRDLLDDAPPASAVTLREGVRSRAGADAVTRVRPALVARVRFGGWTDDGALRAPVFEGLRDDVAPDDCRAAPPGDEDALLAIAPAATTPPARPGRVTLTNQDKVFFPEAGFTKGDLCAWYREVAPWLLPYLADRPIVLVRYPDGIDGKHFFQWNAPPGTPDWVRTHRVERDDGRPVDTFLVDDVDTLLHVANLGAIPIHVLAFRVVTPADCDFLTLDFDVGEATLADAVRLARTLRELLERVGLAGYPKTSGQTGLHVLVPLGPGASFATARTLADLLGRLLVARHPDIATMERRKVKRGRRVLVDTGQTGSSRTIVAPFSVRAQPGAPVSTPLAWDEVGAALDPTRFTIATVLDRLAERGDPMAPMREAAPDLAASVRALGALLT